MKLVKINTLRNTIIHNASAFRTFVMMSLALGIRVILRPHSSPRRRQIWIIGERNGDCHEDNGYALFNYCAKNISDVTAYLVMSRVTYNQHRSDQNRHLYLKYGSPKHAFLCIFADAVLYTVSHRDITYNLLFHLIPKNTVRVFLQHGVTAFKDISKYIAADKLHSADVVISVSDQEKSILTSQCGFKESTVYVTGFSRFDYLPTVSSRDVHRPINILYIPTLRNWISPEEFVQRSLKIQLDSLIRDSYLNAIMNRYTIELHICPHPAYTSAFRHLSLASNQFIKMIQPGTESISQIIRRADILITDYSSLVFDFLYMQKPILFYRFDLSDYLANSGSYFDLHNTMFGPIATTSIELAEAIGECLQLHTSTCSAHEAKSLQQSLFNYVDHRNSLRICEVVKAKVQHEMDCTNHVAGDERHPTSSN